ncbi:MAG: HAMP domain-containing histidine kinase [Bacteroides sp.]|nr:HAMP domain-containing histidine kinase [Bacteroides sp.]
MKRYILKAAVAIGLASIVAMQSLWLADAAKTSEEELRDQLREVLEKAVETEAKQRLGELPKGSKVKSHPMKPDIPEFLYLNDVLLEMGYPPSAQRIDTIAGRLLREQDICESCQIHILKDGETVARSPEAETLHADTLCADYPLYVDAPHIVRGFLHNPNDIVLGRLGFLLCATFGLTLMALAGVLYYLRQTMRERKAGRLKDDFMVAASHDMRNPLATLKIYSEALHDDAVRGDKARSRHYLSLMEQTLDTLQRQVEQNLLIYRMEDGEWPLLKETVHLPAMVEEMKERQSAGRRKIAVHTVYATEEIHAQSDMLWHILSNLYANSLKYTEGEVQITIRTESTAMYDILRFKDNGRGIPRKYHKAIFRKYHRGIHTAMPGRRAPRGHGIGLYLVHGIMKWHGGRVEVQSERGQGTEFLLYFPKALQ